MAASKVNARRAFQSSLTPDSGGDPAAPAPSSPGKSGSTIRRHHTVRDQEDISNYRTAINARTPGRLKIPDVFLSNDAPSTCVPASKTSPVTRSLSLRTPNSSSAPLSGRNPHQEAPAKVTPKKNDQTIPDTPPSSKSSTYHWIPSVNDVREPSRPSTRVVRQAPVQKQSREFDSANSSSLSFDRTSKSADADIFASESAPTNQSRRSSSSSNGRRGSLSNRRPSTDFVDPKYEGFSEEELQAQLRDAKVFEERRKIRAAIRSLRSEGGGSGSFSDQTDISLTDSPSRDDGDSAKPSAVTPTLIMDSRHRNSQNDSTPLLNGVAKEEVEEEKLVASTSSRAFRAATASSADKQPPLPPLSHLPAARTEPEKRAADRVDGLALSTVAATPELASEASPPAGQPSDELEVLEKLLDDTTDLAKRREIRATIRELRRQIREGGSEPKAPPMGQPVAVGVTQKTMNGNREVTVECQQQKDNELCNMRSVTRLERTESQSQVQTKATTVRCHRRTLGGTEYDELNTQITRSKVTRKGSTYVQREEFVEKRTRSGGRDVTVHPPQGDDIYERDLKISVEGANAAGEAKFRDCVTAHTGVVFDVAKKEKEEAKEVEEKEEETKDEEEPSVLAICLPIDDVVVSEGDRMVLTCTVEGMRPEAEVQWSCPPSPARRRARAFPQTGLLRLEVSGAKVTDGGEYRVTVRQRSQEVSSSATVEVRTIEPEETEKTPEIVASKPKEDERVLPLSFRKALPQQLTLNDDEDLLLASELEASGHFSYFWEKDGVRLQHDGHLIIITRSGNRLELRIRGVDADCNGSYRLVVENSAGRRSCTSFVTVRERDPIQLAFVEEPNDVTVTEGEDASLECVLKETDHRAVAVWFLNSQALDARPNAPDNEQHFNGRRAELVLRSVKPEHSGVYSCGVKNSRHTCVCMARVTVKKAPTPPRIVKQLGDQRIRDGDTLVLECTLTERQSGATVSWYLNGEDISGSEGQRMEFNGLTARLVVWDAFEGDCGRYRCVVRTACGECDSECRVSMQSPAIAFDSGLEDVQVTAGDSCRLTATLRAPVAGARVSWSFRSRPAAGVAQFDGRTASLVIGPLTARQAGAYSVRVETRDGRACESACTVAVESPSPKMSDEVDIDTCTDEEALTKLLSKTDNMDRRRQIRARLKDIREAEKKKMEERRKAREQGGNVDSVKTRAQMAEEEKARKLRSYQEQAKAAGEAAPKADAVKAMAERAAQDKAERLKQFDELAKTGGPIAFQGGLESVKKMEQEHAEAEKQRALQSFSNTQKNMHAKARDDQPVPRVHNKGGARGARAGPRPQSAGKAAMSAFKAMDNAANPEGAKKPNFMSNPQPARGGVTRNPSAIKQMLLEWCKAQCNSYEGVNVTNFGSSWADGLAFCALIHHFYPDAFDFSSLNPKNRRANFQLAFDTAEKLADICPLLDVEDMVMMKVPDWKCVFTYVQSFYRRFRNHERNALKAQEPGQSEQ